MHGRGRNPDSMEDLFFGVHDEMLYARKTEPIEGEILFAALCACNFFIKLNSKVLIMLLSILTQNKSRDSASVVDKSTLLSLFGGNDC